MYCNQCLKASNLNLEKPNEQTTPTPNPDYSGDLPSSEKPSLDNLLDKLDSVDVGNFSGEQETARTDQKFELASAYGSNIYDKGGHLSKLYDEY